MGWAKPRKETKVHLQQSTGRRENSKLKMYIEVICLWLSFDQEEVKEEYGHCGPF